MIINILIRTSYRPSAFARCIESIQNQNIPEGTDVHIFIGYDNPLALNYINKVSHSDSIDLTQELKTGKFFYNGYLNKMIKHHSIRDGHILFLDDDDELSPNFFIDAEKFVKPGYSYIFPFVRPNGFQKPTPNMMSSQKICAGYIGLPCLLLSTKHRSLVRFNQNEFADFDAINILSFQINLIWINLPIVRASLRSFGAME